MQRLRQAVMSHPKHEPHVSNQCHVVSMLNATDLISGRIAGAGALNFHSIRIFHHTIAAHDELIAHALETAISEARLPKKLVRASNQTQSR